MTSEQYEELCRRFIADKEKLGQDCIKSARIPNPRRPGLPKYSHQIDLYWDTGGAIAAYFNIANAKWRSSAKVEQGEVLLLQQVRQKVAAHKAFMITNVGFTAGAIAVGKDEGIALHVLEPTFDATCLPADDRDAIQAKLTDIASGGRTSIWAHRAEHRGLGFGKPTHVPGDATSAAPGTRSGAHQTRMIQPTQRTSPPPANRALGRADSHGGSVQRADRSQGPPRRG